MAEALSSDSTISDMEENWTEVTKKNKKKGRKRQRMTSASSDPDNQSQPNNRSTLKANKNSKYLVIIKGQEGKNISKIG